MNFILKMLPISLLMPMVALAQSNPGNLEGIRRFINNIVDFMNGTLVPLIFALAFLMFLWGMFKTFILGGSNEDKQAEGKQLMMYSVAGFVVMVSLWGIVNLVANSLGLREENISDIPNLPRVNN